MLIANSIVHVPLVRKNKIQRQKLFIYFSNCEVSWVPMLKLGKWHVHRNDFSNFPPILKSVCTLSQLHGIIRLVPLIHHFPTDSETLVNILRIVACKHFFILTPIPNEGRNYFNIFTCVTQGGRVSTVSLRMYR